MFMPQTIWRECKIFLQITVYSVRSTDDKADLSQLAGTADKVNYRAIKHGMHTAFVSQTQSATIVAKLTLKLPHSCRTSDDADASPKVKWILQLDNLILASLHFSLT